MGIKQKNKTLLNSVRDFKQTLHLPQYAILEETYTLRLIHHAIFLICFMIFIAAVWAANTNIKETAITFGEAVPSGTIHTIQHFEGGIVSKIYVTDGMRVKKGQLLLEFDPTTAHSELDQMKSRELALQLDIKRLRSLLLGRTEKFYSDASAFIDDVTANRSDMFDTMLNDEEFLLAVEALSHQDQVSVLKAQLAQNTTDLQELETQKKILKTEIDLLRKEHELFEGEDQGIYFSKRELIKLKKEINQAYGDLAQTSNKIAKATQTIAETKGRLNELNSGLYKNIVTELSDKTAELLELQKAIIKRNDRVKRLKVYAPIDGTVKGLAVVKNSVLPQGGAMLDVVPHESKLIIETHVSTKDIGHIKVGDDAKIKIMTYEYARYGTIEGVVTKLSATTFKDEQSEPYFKATIEPAKQYLGENPKYNRLQAGMTAEADIITGEKTVLEYLLKPIHTTLNKAFRER